MTVTEKTWQFFHWPDHVIGKRESRRIREQHNATLNQFLQERDDLICALRNLLSISRFVDQSATHDGLKACDVIGAARAAISKAEKGA